MVRFLIGGTAWFGFSIILVEMINNFNLFSFQLNALGSAVLLTLVYLGFDASYLFFQKKAEATNEADRTRYQTIVKQYRIILGVIGLILVVSIPFIWWGVIKKLAGMAQEGGRLF